MTTDCESSAEFFDLCARRRRREIDILRVTAGRWSWLWRVEYDEVLPLLTQENFENVGM